MNHQQVILVQASFEQIRSAADQVAADFYQRLFAAAPAVRPLFRGDMWEQGRKLMGMLAIVVGGLARLDELLPAVAELGRRHSGYGVEAEHYDLVGETLIQTLAHALGEAFTPETEIAWRAAYRVLAATMKNAGSSAVAA